MDVLEALGSTKRIVEELKHQLDENEHYNHNPMSSPDRILMELKQAYISLSKTMDDLVKIQSSSQPYVWVGGAVSLAEELSRVRETPHMVVETDEIGLNQQNKNYMITAEMRLVAISKWKKLQERGNTCDC
ncbi:hypothetical protein IGI04_019571 [Brassica rapa subsp. trilocularis]|uniref:Uncharacterized protein n=1 Tax=Brassica rapa subsp. trilocularis TaxID=1813537 RepID=A0ABQ7MG82_BRACM|nr:hypothetical protein IGI04_019571 [Brassica rapa subsp. trilocularis]